MDSNPNISVVIPTLNTRSKFLKEALDSIKKQTYKPLEVIIVNNGDKDLDLSKTNLNISIYKIIYKGGVAQARNFGACFAKGDYIAFLDDDDLWGNDYLKYINEHIKNYKPDCLIGKLDQLQDGKITPFKNAHKNISKDIILERNPGITGSSVVINKNVFFNLGGYNPKLPPSEDKSLILELINNGLKVITVPESQAIIRKSEIDRLTNNNKTLYEGIFQFYRIYKDQMNFNQKIINLYKIYKYLWITKKNILTGVIFFVLFVLVRLTKYMK